MRALITGCGGFVGGHLAEHLQAHGGDEVRIWGTLFSASEAGRSRLERVETRVVDLRDPAAVDDVFSEARPDVIFHLAAQSFVPEAWRAPWATIETNVRMQFNILETMAKRVRAGESARLVVASTNEVYGGPPPDQLPTDENAPLAPANAYATSKAAQDLLAGQYYRSHGVDVVRVRPFTHIGPGQDDRFVAASFARQVAEIEAGRREPVVRVGYLDAERDFSDVRDIVRGYRLAAAHGRGGTVYNLGAGRSHAVREILDHFLARSRVAVTVLPDPDRMRPSDVPRTLCDARRAREALGWTPEIPFEQTLDDILEDHRRQVAELEQLTVENH